MVFRYLKNTVVFSVVAAGIISACVVGFFAACDDPNNPFSNSLGAKVDIEPPTVTVTSPISGAYLKNVARFEGNATAYRELKSVEIKIYDPDESKEPILDWTTTGIKWVGAKDTSTYKEWYYELDTKNFFGPETPLVDGFLRIQFRARDKNLYTDTVELVYIVKNDPSIVKLTAPDSAKLETESQAPKIGTGTEVRGQILDRRGIKPGYPRIKIWPEDKEEPLGNELGDPDNGWGWAVLFLSGVDDPGLGTGYYANRNEMPVVRAANFVFPLCEFKIDPNTRQVVYDRSGDGGNLKPLKTGLYRFRILTSDTFFNSDIKDDDPEKAKEKARVYLWPRDPIVANDEVEAVGYYPADTAATLDSGLSHSMQLVSSGVRPYIRLDNEDISPVELAAVPNIYMTEPTAKKSLKADKNIFRLRILAGIDGGLIEKAILEWEHKTSKGTRMGFLAWDKNNPLSTDPDDWGYVTDNPADSAAQAEEGHIGTFKDTTNEFLGKNFVFTATGKELDSSATPAPIFINSTEPYTLKVTVYSTDGVASQPVSYTVYLDGSAPTVNIRSMMGAYSDPTGSSVKHDDKGGFINDNPYVVNGNIQVSIDRSANMGIESVRWIVEEDKPNYLTLTDGSTTLQKLEKYFKDPTADNLQFFKNIVKEGQQTEGWERAPIAGAYLEADRGNNLKFNTFKPKTANPAENDWDNKYLWLYIIAEDAVQNLGFILQKLQVRDETDVPVLTVSLAGTNIIAGKEALFYGVNPARRNVLGIYNGIDVSITDDDGVSLASGRDNVEVTLTDLNGDPEVTRPIVIDRSVLNGTNNYETDSSREWIGTLTQQIMARARYGSDTTKARLDDGLYSIKFTVKDNDTVKVKIDPTNSSSPGYRPGNEAGSVWANPTPPHSQTFFFAVQSQEPTVRITAPLPGSTQNQSAVPVYGTVQSPFLITDINITFTPNVLTGITANAGAFIELGTPTRVGGNYEYAWKMVTVAGGVQKDIQFAASGYSEGSRERSIVVSARDGLGYTGTGNVSMTVDNTPPEIKLGAFNFSRPPQTSGTYAGRYVVNGKVPITINVYDQGGIQETGDLAHIRWWIQRSTAAVPTWTTGYPTGVNGAGGQFAKQPVGNNDYSVLLYTGGSTGGLTNGAVYRLYVMAEDKASNRTPVAEMLREFTVDQDSDYPVIEASSLEPELNAFINTDLGLTIRGSVADDDEFISANADKYVEIRFPTSVTVSDAVPPVTTITWGGWTAVTTATLGAGGLINFSYDAPLTGYLSGDGIKYYQIRVTDEAANKNPAGIAVPSNPTLGAVTKIFPTDTTGYAFNVKNTPPLIFFNNNDPTAPTTTVPRPGYSGSARPTFSTAAGVIARLTGYVEESYLPKVENNPINIIYSNNGTSATFDQQVLGYTTSGKTHTWSINTAITNYLTTAFNNAPNTDANNGMHTITFIAADELGSVARVDWTFYKDTKKPDISANNAGVFTGTSPTIKGKFFDDYSNVANTYRYRFYSDPSASHGTWITVTIPAGSHQGKTADWEQAIPSSREDGVHYLEISVADVLGNTWGETGAEFKFTVDRNPPIVSAADYMRATGTNIPPDNSGKLPYEQRVFSAAGVGSGDTNAANAVFTLSGLVYERNLTGLTASINPGGGAAAIQFDLPGIDTWIEKGAGTAYTGGAEVVVDGVTITLDSKKTIPGYSAYADSPNSITIPAKAAATTETTAQFSIRRALATDLTAGGVTIDTTTGMPAVISNDLFVWSLQVRRSDLAALLGLNHDEGVRRYIAITAKDVAGHSSARGNWEFTLDQKKPVIKFSGIADGTAFASLNLPGTVEDDTNIRTLQFAIAKYDYTANEWRYYSGTDWTLTETTVTDAVWRNLLDTPYTPAKNVSWTLNATNLSRNGLYPATLLNTDGQYLLKLRSDDYSLSAASANAGNRGEGELRFFIDKTDPTLNWVTERKEYYTTRYSSGKLTFTINAEDLNAIQTGAALKAVVKDYSTKAEITGPTINITITGTASALVGSTFRSVLTVEVSGLASGQRYTLELTVMDQAGNRASVGNTLDFYLDTVEPTIAITPSGNASNTAASEAITGRVVFQGNFTKNAGSPVSRVAFAAGATAPAALPADFSSRSAADQAAALTAAGWQFNGTGGTPTLSFNGNIVLEIDQGVATAKLLLPNTRLFGESATAAGTYLTQAGATAPAGTTFEGVTITGETVNQLRLYFLAIDEAGNQTTITRNYWIYPEGDRPKVVVKNPDQTVAEAQRMLNGRVRISGTATDNVRVKYVWFRVIDKEPTIGGVANTKYNQPMTLYIPKWNEETWDALTGTGAGNQDPQPLTNIPTTPAFEGGNGGWYMANGGGSSSVSWWAYINTENELDPTAGNTRKIEIQVVAEDTIWNDKLDSLNGAYETGKDNGLKSKNSAVSTMVVQGAPRFEDEWVRLGGSNNTLPPSAGWGSVNTTNVSGTAAYAITVKHELGVGAIRWIKGTNNIVSLLDGTVGTDTGITSVKADAKTKLTGTIRIGTAEQVAAGTADTTSTTFMIWVTGSSAPSTATENAKYERFTVPAGTTSFSSNGATLLPMTAEGVFEWVVVVDIDSTVLVDSAGGGTWAGKSGLYGINLSASEISKTVPLTASYTAQIPIDNLPPQVMYTLSTNVAGSAPSFGGEAGDAGVVGGLSKVVLWFSRVKTGTTEESISWSEILTTSPTITYRDFVAGTAANGGARPANVTIPAGVTWPAGINYPATESYTANGVAGNYSSIVIDRNDPQGREIHNGHQLRMGFASSGGALGTSWYVSLDSTKITSGKITAHYVVFDKAGNATYGSQKLMVLNGKPSIKDVQLATDIYGGNGLALAASFNGASNNNLVNGGRGTAGTVGVMTNTTNLVALPAGAGNRHSVLDIIKSRFAERITGIDTASSNAAVGISDSIPINTERLNDYSVVYDNPFTVRNNLLAMRINALIPQMANKTRTYRLEYVQNMRQLSGRAAIINETTGIREGRMYIIENIGNGNFPWPVLGAQGETPRRGLTFIATVDGSKANIADLTYGTPVVWELNGDYYKDTSQPLTRTVPAALQLADVSYPTANAASNSDIGNFAEFVYQSGAFTGTNGIRDFAPAAADFQANGLPRSYPFSSLYTGTGTGNIYTPAHSLFILRIFDGPESDLFGDFALLSIRVNNNDKTVAYSQMYDLNPKTEGVDTAQTRAQALSAGTNMGQNRTRGGLFNEGTQAKVEKSGHIEPRGRSGGNNVTSLTSLDMGGAVSAATQTITKPVATAAGYFAIDTVSGNVIVRGYAEDNQRVGRVALQFWNETNNTQLGNEIVILDYNAPPTAAPTGGNKLPAVGFLQRATGQTADTVNWTESLDLNRHRVEWAYVWNAENVSGTPVGNITVRVLAYNNNTTRAANLRNPHPTASNQPTPTPARTTFDDFNPTFPSATSQTSTGNFYRYNEIRVNLRPYITGFKRNQSQFSHDTRSRQGRYMFYRGETVVIKGFNLGGASAPTITLPSGSATAVTNGNGAANSTVSADGATAFGLTNNTAARYRIFTVPAAHTTGHGMVTYGIQNGGTGTTYSAVNTSAERGVTTIATPAGRRPNYTQPWNIEYSPGVDGSELWDDFTMIHIWQSDNTTTGYDQGAFKVANLMNVMDPAMSINPVTGVLYASHNEAGTGANVATGGAGASAVSSNAANTTARILTATFCDPIRHSDVFVSDAGTIWNAYSIIGKQGGATAWTGFGGVYVTGISAISNTGNTPTWAGGGNAGLSVGRDVNNQYIAESTYYNASTAAPGTQATPPSTDQFHNPHVVVDAVGGNNNIHVSYYDEKDKSLKYRYNRQGSPGTVNSATGSVYAWTNLDGGFDADDQVQFNAANTAGGNWANPIGGTGGFVPAIAANGRVVNYTARNAIAVADRINAGKHNSIALTSQGYPIIAYFDETSQRLKMAVSNNTVPVAATYWRIVESSTIFATAAHQQYRDGTGEYVSLKIDTVGRGGNAANTFHIAALNSDSKNLVYIKGVLPANPVTGTITISSVQIVDSVGNVGTWCSLSLDAAGNPWISYQDESYRGSRDGVKVAYLNADRFTKGSTGSTFAGQDTDLNGTTISGWEAMHVPTQFRVENARLGMERFPTARNVTANKGAANGLQTFAAVGYLGEDRYRVAYYVE